MINQVSKNPKPQHVVVPASAENSILDMIGAHSDVINQKLPTTFKPSFPTNMKQTYTAPVTTFHPSGTQIVSMFNPRTTAHTLSTYHPRATPRIVPTFANYQPKSTVHSVSTFHPKATLPTHSLNDIPMNVVSTYHPKTATFKVTPELNVASSQAPSTNVNQKYSSRFSAQTTHFTPTNTPPMRPNVKQLLATIGLEPDNSEQPSPAAFLPTTIKPTVTSATKPTITTTITTTTTTGPEAGRPELTPELKELLESFGLLTNEEPPAHLTAGPFQDEFRPVIPSSLKDETLSVNEFRPLPKSVTASDIGKIDGSFEIKADDFSAFKPLPVPEEKPATDEELESLLKSYGLLEEDERGSKEIDSEIERLNADAIDNQDRESEQFEVKVKPNGMSQVPEVDVAFLSPELAKVLGNIGVKNVNQQVASTRTTPTITRRVDTTTPMQYSPGQIPSSTMENDYQKLHLLLDTIKQLENLNANLTEEELEKLNLKNFNLSRDTLVESEGPDPTVDFESTQAVKNEVKRQINSSEPTRIQLDVTGTTPTSGSSTDDDDLDDFIKSDDEDETKLDDLTSDTPKREGKNDDLEKATEKPSSSTSTTSTTEEPRNGSISDLAGSFGGNDGLDAVSEEPLPPPRKNGFYFFSDWNSFLEVGEDPDRVVVRFDPKIGDSSQFVKIKIP